MDGRHSIPRRHDPDVAGRVYQASQPTLSTAQAPRPTGRSARISQPPLLAPPLSVSLIYDNLMYSRQTRPYTILYIAGLWKKGRILQAAD